MKREYLILLSALGCVAVWWFVLRKGAPAATQTFSVPNDGSGITNQPVLLPPIVVTMPVT